MLQHEELDPQCPLTSQFADKSGEATILINLFRVDKAVDQDFKTAWEADAAYFTKQPGCLSAQLHQGIGASSLFLSYAVFENTTAFADSTTQPPFAPLRRVYPDGAIAHPHLFRRVAIPDICVGEEKYTPGPRQKAPQHGLSHVELDPQAPLSGQFADTLDEATMLLNLFHVDRADQDDFKLAWQQDSEFFCNQPGYISAQLHQGIGASSLFLNYAVFQNTAAFAATQQQPEFGPLRKIYPDSTVAHPHLFRRLAIPLICVGEAR